MTKPNAQRIADQLRAAFEALRSEHPEDRFYLYGIFTDEDGAYLAATAASEEGLAGTVSRYRKRSGKRSVEELRRDLRFSAPDSPYHETPAPGLSAFAAGKKLHDACFEALRILDREGFFGQGEARAEVIINVVYGDMSDERWLDHARALNPPDAVERALPFLRLHVPSGRVSRWGGNAYQVNALSLSADRSLLAYTGSGGEVGVLRVSDHRALFEKQRKGEHWACALSPDGSRLFLGDKGGVLVLDVRSGTTSTFAKTGQPSCLALSPGGDRLAVSSWGAPLRVYDVPSRAVLWERRDIGSAALAFSPAGLDLGVSFLKYGGKEPEARLACLDGESGGDRWAASLQSGRSTCFAWAPRGDELLAAASRAVVEPGTVHRIVRFASSDGSPAAAIPAPIAVSAIAVAPGGESIAVAGGATLAVLDREGVERARGTGAQEDLAACAFLDDWTVVAVGRDVNCGPTVLELNTGE